MAKCNNCAVEAVYDVKYPTAKAQGFCEAHLPWFFKKGDLPPYVLKIESEKDVVTTTKKPAKKSAPEPVAVVVEPIVEEPIVPVVEELPEVAIEEPLEN